MSSQARDADEEFLAVRACFRVVCYFWDEAFGLRVSFQLRVQVSDVEFH